MALARVALSLRPLIDQLEAPVRVWPDRDGKGTGHELLQRIAAATGLPQLAILPGPAPTRATLFELIVSDRLMMSGPHDSGYDGPTPDELDQIIAEVVHEDFDQAFKKSSVVSFDGVVLSAFEAGVRSEKAIVIAGACGMPAKLCERWLRVLGEDHFVITWESRGLFGVTPDFDAVAHDVAAQAGDLFVVMDHYGVKVAHVMGLCGGAVIALTAAATCPTRVSSLSLWHGDFELGPNCPKTKHQQNLKALLDRAAESRATAASIRDVFCQSILLDNVRSNWAHLVVYPYASAELLFRYARLNGSIMRTNVSSILEKVIQPTLTVTSEADGTTHSAGSRLVAAGLPNATLRITRDGSDHLSLFDAAEKTIQLASHFIARNP